MFKFCKKCVGMRQFLPNGHNDNLKCDICGLEI